MRPKLISLDVWNTLISPNPDYAAARDRFLRAELPMDFDEAKAVYRRHKDNADQQAEACGEGLSSAATYKRFRDALGLPEHYDWYPLRRGLELAFAQHPPIVLPEVVQALRRAQAAGIKLSIGSNTNFIRGQVLHDTTLATWGVAWEFQVFSDEIECSKPHPDFWRCVADCAASLGIGNAAGEIVHIGDNRVCDGGCAQHGMDFHYTPNPAGLPAVIESLLA